MEAKKVLNDVKAELKKELVEVRKEKVKIDYEEYERLQKTLEYEVVQDADEFYKIITHEPEFSEEDLEELLRVKKDIAILRTEQHLAKITGIAKFWHVFGIVALIVLVVLELVSLLNLV